MKQPTGKVALVIGGSGGIDAATARALADQVADVAISMQRPAMKQRCSCGSSGPRGFIPRLLRRALRRAATGAIIQAGARPLRPA